MTKASPGLASPSTGRPDRHGRVKIGPTPKTRKLSTSRLRECVISNIGELRNRWQTVFRQRAPSHLPRHLAIPCPGVSAPGRSVGRLGWRMPTSSRWLSDARGFREAGGGLEPPIGKLKARYRAGPRMARPDAAGDGAYRWLCLERQELSQPVESGLRYTGHPLERTEVLRLARQVI